MAYSKQNFQNGQTLDAANLETMENGIIAGQGAYNLLDNSDFTNPVNQRGQTSYTGAGDTIDRWKAGVSDCSMYVNAGKSVAFNTKTEGVNAYWRQYLPHSLSQLEGKTFTLAIKDAWGKTHCASGVYPTSAPSDTKSVIWINMYENVSIVLYCATDGTAFVQLTTKKSVPISWVALYEGSYTTDTLPSYVSKGKHVEMLNCNVPLAPRNLLDNSDFRNPVNQRGKTSYGGGEYAIDRWKNQSGTNINIMDGFIRITGNWDAKQILGNKLIGTYTYAIYAKVNVAGEYTQTIEIHENGSSIATSFCTAVGEWKIYTCTATFTGGTNPVVTINNRAGSVSDASIDVKWAALYEGSYDASTLPAYQPKGYAAELAECQRYYENSWFGVGKTATQEYFANVWNSKQADARIEFKQQKRISPTITFYPIGTESNWKIFNNGYNFVDSVENKGRGGLSGFIARVSKGSSDGTTWTVGYTIQAQGHWEASADL